ncbi:hypothetical protein [Lichenifustis flavocetrariae]|uniref:Uncharacterized protein n=1 Tax=Lichenifustis flavocetrariae TaxID=2949735 RepID=A0AA41Z951_9HYPH|nr:hypothetical protein [Lichenifustis flavocetrariae]MCW6512788.1 hypothetical protein [Lichenifustis flavocetrariae]
MKQAEAQTEKEGDPGQSGVVDLRKFGFLLEKERAYRRPRSEGRKAGTPAGCAGASINKGKSNANMIYMLKHSAQVNVAERHSALLDPVRVNAR